MHAVKIVLSLLIAGSTASSTYAGVMLRASGTYFPGGVSETTATSIEGSYYEAVAPGNPFGTESFRAEFDGSVKMSLYGDATPVPQGLQSRYQQVGVAVDVTDTVRVTGGTGGVEMLRLTFAGYADANFSLGGFNPFGPVAQADYGVIVYTFPGGGSPPQFVQSSDVSYVYFDGTGDDSLLNINPFFVYVPLSSDGLGTFQVRVTGSVASVSGSSANLNSNNSFHLIGIAAGDGSSLESLGLTASFEHFSVTAVSDVPAPASLILWSLGGGLGFIGQWLRRKRSSEFAA